MFMARFRNVISQFFINKGLHPVCQALKESSEHLSIAHDTVVFSVLKKRRNAFVDES